MDICIKDDLFKKYSARSSIVNLIVSPKEKARIPKVFWIHPLKTINVCTNS